MLSYMYFDSELLQLAVRVRVNKYSAGERVSSMDM